ncbi:MAG: hypothetical protein QXI49_05495 [Candidatus Methanomethylicaceae archaeon]
MDDRTIKVKDDTYLKLRTIQLELIKKTNKAVTMDEVINELIKKATTKP